LSEHGREGEAPVEETSQKLVTEAIRGERGAWALLVKCYTDRLWRLAFNLLYDRQLAGDIVHETFLKAQQNLTDFRGDGSVEAWLAQICRNCCTDENRRYKRTAAHATIKDVADSDMLSTRKSPYVSGWPARTEEEWATRLTLEWAMDQVEDEEREAFILIKGMGYTSEEAARIAGVAPSTMRSRVGRAKSKLARLLREGR
jgi:RNA polymerase sigma-70 factor, ECF subfamily